MEITLTQLFLFILLTDNSSKKVTLRFHSCLIVALRKRYVILSVYSKKVIKYQIRRLDNQEGI